MILPGSPDWVLLYESFPPRPKLQTICFSIITTTRTDTLGLESTGSCEHVCIMYMYETIPSTSSVFQSHIQNRLIYRWISAINNNNCSSAAIFDSIRWSRYLGVYKASYAYINLLSHRLEPRSIVVLLERLHQNVHSIVGFGDLVSPL